MTSTDSATPATPSPTSPTLHAGLLALLLGAAAFAGRGRGLGPVPLVLGSLLYLALVALVPRLRRTRPPLAAGTFTRPALLLAVATSGVSALALVLWQRLAGADVADLRALVPPLAPAGLVALGVAFALGNAATEELVFRGVLLPALESEFGRAAGLALHAVVFGAVHAESGFPRGLSGFALVAVYGAVLGLLARISRGLVLPWLAHVVADATIFALVVLG